MSQVQIVLSDEIQRRMLWWQYFNPPTTWLFWLRRIMGPFCLLAGIYTSLTVKSDVWFYYGIVSSFCGIYYLLRPFILMSSAKGIVERSLTVSIENKKLIVEEKGKVSEINLNQCRSKLHKRFIELEKDGKSILLPKNALPEAFRDELLDHLNY